jgi:hypothetical protein
MTVTAAGVGVAPGVDISCALAGSADADTSTPKIDAIRDRRTRALKIRFEIRRDPGGAALSGL